MYLIAKDGMWLVGYQPSDCKEYMSDGTLKQVYTCVYSMRREDAMPFTSAALAKDLAKRIGGETMKV